MIMELELIKDFVELAVAVIGIPVALVSAREAIVELKSSNKEKEIENRHKQAAVARDILKDIFDNEKSRNAMKMLDWDGREYGDCECDYEEWYTVTFKDVRNALRVKDLSFEDKECFIRDCFEDLFDKFELIQHYINIGFLNFDDVKVPLHYYAEIIKDKLDEFEPFLDEYGYPNAKRLILNSSS
jgi:hypothetical protein